MDKRGALGFLRIFSYSKNPYSELLQQKIKDLMTEEVLTISKSRKLSEAAHTMIGSHISCLVVMHDQKPVGILTERDFIKKLSMAKEVAKETTVEDLMTTKVVTAGPNTSLFDSMNIMRQHNFRKVVVTEGGKLLGILTQTDLCRALSKMRTPIPDCPTVRSVMTKKVVTASPDDKFEDVKKLMSQKDMGSVVVEKNGEILGMFTEFDIVSEYFFNPNRLRNSYMKDLLISPVVCITPEFPLTVANKFMLEKNFRRLPIIENGKLVGIVTQTDVARNIYMHLEKNKDKKYPGMWKYKEPTTMIVRTGNVILCDLKKN